MTDIKSPEERSKNMSAIKRADTKPELYVRKLLFANGFRYRIQSKSIPGHPDIWLKKYNTAIFVHGCFWHRHMGCKYAYIPKSRVEFWNDKFKRNIERDRTVREELLSRKIRCLIIWECSINKYQKEDNGDYQLVKQISNFLMSDEDEEEI